MKRQEGLGEKRFATVDVMEGVGGRDELSL